MTVLSHVKYQLDPVLYPLPVLKLDTKPLDPPKIEKVTPTGPMRGELHGPWYNHQCKLAAEYGVDPYLFIAFSIIEYGGYETGPEPPLHGALQLQLQVKDRGRKFAAAHGASGVLIWDALHAGAAHPASVQRQIRGLGAKHPNAKGDTTLNSSNGLNYYYNGDFYDSRPSIADATKLSDRVQYTELVDRQSFIFFKELQDNILRMSSKSGLDSAVYQAPATKQPGGAWAWPDKQTTESSIFVGLQSLNGLGAQWRMWRNEYSSKKLGDYYNQKNKSLFSRPAQYKSCGVFGNDHPMYGYTLASWISALRQSAAMRKVVETDNPNYKTPISSRIVRGAAQRGLTVVEQTLSPG